MISSVTPFQDGHPIDDITWMRYRKKESGLKVRHANEDGTGVYTCKGINGFGSAEARIEVIVVGECCSRKWPNRIDPPCEGITQ